MKTFVVGTHWKRLINETLPRASQQNLMFWQRNMQDFNILRLIESVLSLIISGKDNSYCLSTQFNSCSYPNVRSYTAKILSLSRGWTGGAGVRG